MVKVSTVILAVLFALSAAYSLVVIAAPTIVLEGDFQAMTGRSYKGILDADAERVALVHIRHMEVFAITATISAFFILFAGFRKEQKWAWWAMLILGAIAWGYGTVLNLLIGNRFDFVVFLVGFVVYMVALFLPIKRFLTRSA